MAMAHGIASVSRTELTQRRKQLRQKRRVRALQGSWRVVAVSALAGGSVWLATLPDWLIRKPDQIAIEGNQFIPTRTIRSLLPVDYPQSLLRLQPEALAKELKAKAPISEVRVSRRLFPPGLTIQVQERYPAAITEALITNSSAAQVTELGLLDASGMWTPLERYNAVKQTLKLPDLKVVGQRSTYQSYWPKLYEVVRRSPVKISEINLQNPANLILKTELGTVYFGPFSPQFQSQLAALDRMRKLPERVKLDQMAYIDLSNPASPMIQMN
jgi:cell division protein FtsQ